MLFIILLILFQKCLNNLKIILIIIICLKKSNTIEGTVEDTFFLFNLSKLIVYHCPLINVTVQQV